MQTMDGKLEELVDQGVITPMAALEKALDKESFKRLAKVAELVGKPAAEA